MSRKTDLMIVPIHGSFVDSSSIRGDEWWQKDSAFSTSVLEYLDDQNHRIFWEPFAWSGANSLKERGKASRELAAISSEKKLTDRNCVFLCHSHGGNVLNNSRNYKGTGTKHLRGITVGTPYLPEFNYGSNSFLKNFHQIFNFFIYSSILVFFALELFLLPKVLDAALMGYLAISTTFVLMSYIVEFSIRFLSDAFDNNSTIVHKLYHKLILTVEGEYENKPLYLRNILDIKIFSIFDEAILTLREVHRQKITLASRENATAPATIIIALISFAAIVFFTQYYEILMFSNPALVDYEFWSTNDPEMQSSASKVNVIADTIFLIIICLVAGRVLAEGPISDFFSAAFNRQLTRLSIDKSLGYDDKYSLSIASRISQNLPTIFSETPNEYLWKPLPKKFDDGMKEILENGIISSAFSMRSSLSNGMYAPDSKIFSSISENLSGDELVHTSYFRHPQFSTFVAWLLVEQFGFPPSEKYKSLDLRTCEEWFLEIAPKEFFTNASD